MDLDSHEKICPTSVPTGKDSGEDFDSDFDSDKDEMIMLKLILINQERRKMYKNLLCPNKVKIL